MIKELIIENYQSHENTHLYFDKGVNVIFGRSLNGKTVIIRCLNWLFNNRPLGFGYHSNFTDEKHTSVKLILFSGDIVELSKTKSKAIYRLNGEEYTGIGSDVPDAVREILNLGDINIQNQLDAHYLITGTSGEVARTINEITNLESVDLWVSKITSQINKDNQRRDFLVEEIKVIENKLRSYRRVKRLKLLHEKLQKKVLKVKNIQTNIWGMEKLIEDIEDVEGKLKKFAKREKILKEIDNIEIIESKINYLEIQYEDLKEFQTLISNIDKLEVGEKDIKYLMFLEELQRQENNLRDLLDYISEIKRNIVLFCNEEKRAKSEYLKALEDEGICPVCFRIMDEKTLRSMENEL